MMEEVVPALLWMLISLVVEVQRDFSIKTDSKVIIHDALLCETIPAHTHRQTDIYLLYIFDLLS